MALNLDEGIGATEEVWLPKKNPDPVAAVVAEANAGVVADAATGAVACAVTACAVVQRIRPPRPPERGSRRAVLTRCSPWLARVAV